MAVDLSNHKLGRKAAKIKKKFPALVRLSSLGKLGKIKYETKNKRQTTILVLCLDKANINNNNKT
jgi:hypothetical protein